MNSLYDCFRWSSAPWLLADQNKHKTCFVFRSSSWTRCDRPPASLSTKQQRSFITAQHDFSGRAAYRWNTSAWWLCAHQALVFHRKHEPRSVGMEIYFMEILTHESSRSYARSRRETFVDRAPNPWSTILAASIGVQHSQPNRTQLQAFPPNEKAAVRSTFEFDLRSMPRSVGNSYLFENI